ncbi:uncharacterized protein LOC118512896 [Anopheles stephensi]|uniref:uncharacterized protein LOC118512896 n=1 Tax=Anopheles stephensi TaxID=30069 RepID=UPI0016589F46|nr:uncharacterized protein LOC118512896 [Anopheles stephensi]
MSEIKVVQNSANDLLLLGDAIRNVPLKEIAQKSLKGLRRQESDIDLYEFLFTNIIRQFEPREFEADVSCAILPELVCFLEKIQSEVQSNALSCFFVENLTLLLKLADVLLKLIEYLTEKEQQCQLLRSLVIFPEYLVRCYTIVRKHYSTMAHETEALETMKALYAVCKKLLLAFLELLYPREASGRNYFRAIDYDTEYDCLEKVCILLANVGNEISPIDSLLASDVWKVIVKLCTEHVEESFSHKRTGWLDEIITILNNGIGGSFHDVRSKNEPTKQSTIALKLNAFFLRVMLKILTLTKQHVTESTYSCIIRSLLEIKTCLRTKAICSELMVGVEQYLHIGYMAIVEHSFRSESFAKALSQYDCKTQEEIHSFYTLTMHIVTQLLANKTDNGLQSLYCYRHPLLQHVSGLLKRSDALLYANSTLYKQLFVHCTALILMGVRVKNRAAQKRIEETLVRMILQDHYYTALFGIDLWSIFVRYHSIPLTYAYFLFWKKVNDHYSIFTSRPKQVYVRQLLRNLFVFLPVTHKERVMIAYPATDSANDRLWVALCPLTSEIDESKRKQFLAGLEARLVQSTQAWQKAPGNVKTFYEVLALLKITATVTKPIEMPQLRWGAIMKTPSTYSVFDSFERSAPRLCLSPLLSSSNVPALTEATPFVKVQTLKLIMAANSGSTIALVNGQSMLEKLLRDKVPLVKAYALLVLLKLNDKQRPVVVQELLSQQPHLRAQLIRLQSNNNIVKLPPFKPSPLTAVVHRCHDRKVDSCESLGSQVNELFPDNDGDELIQDINVDMFAETGSLAKKRKFDATRVEDHGADGGQINQCLKELQSQTVRLERLASGQSGRRLQPSEKGQLRSIIASLTRVLDS